MKKLIVLLLISINGFGQTKLEIANFSDKYKAVLTIEEGYEEEVFKKGNITVFELKTNQKIIDVNSDELTYDLDDDGYVKTNVLELPYGEQSSIIYEDFNFDGIKDLAVMDGQNSCYHGPSYLIYLEINGKPELSQGFTHLAQDYCGMFSVDKENRMIHTMTKSGCCWHQFSDFKVIDNEPIVVKVVEEELDISGLKWNYSEKNRINGKMIEKKFSVLREDNDVIFKFNTKSGKTVQLFHSDGMLYYAFTDSNHIIELFYNGEFVFNKNKKTVSFVNQKVKYKISNNGIVVTTPKKKVTIKAMKNSLEGNLSEFLNLDFENMVVK